MTRLLTKSVLKAGGLIQPEAGVVINKNDITGSSQATFKGIFILPGSHLSNINVMAANIKSSMMADKLTAPEDPTVWRISAMEYPNKSAPKGNRDVLKYLIKKNWNNTEIPIKIM
jgi:hypothetical protein